MDDTLNGSQICRYTICKAMKWKVRKSLKQWAGIQFKIYEMFNKVAIVGHLYPTYIYIIHIWDCYVNNM